MDHILIRCTCTLTEIIEVPIGRRYSYWFELRRAGSVPTTGSSTPLIFGGAQRLNISVSAPLRSRKCVKSFCNAAATFGIELKAPYAIEHKL